MFMGHNGSVVLCILYIINVYRVCVCVLLFVFACAPDNNKFPCLAGLCAENLFG